MKEEFKTIVNEAVAPLTQSLKDLAIDHNISNYDIWTETGRSEVEQKEFKTAMIKYYKRGVFYSRKVRCMMTNDLHRRDHVIAEHIWKQKMHGRGLHRFNLKREDACSPRNGILMLKDIEDQFTVKHICILYISTDQVFVIKVLDPSIMDRNITNSKKTFRDINNRKLSHPKGCFPFRRLLSFHAKLAFKEAREKGWITEVEESSYQPFHDLSDGASVPSIE